MQLKLECKNFNFLHFYRAIHNEWPVYRERTNQLSCNFAHIGFIVCPIGRK